MNLATAAQTYTSDIATQTQRVDVWISSTEFAELSDITPSGAYKALIKCLSGSLYYGETLTIRMIKGISGQGGKKLQVFVPSLPKDLRDKWHKRHPTAFNAPTIAPEVLPMPEYFDSRMGKEVMEWQWKLSIIAPALDFPRQSKGRGTVLADIAEKSYKTPGGKIVTYSVGTLREWIRKVEEGDTTELARKRRPKGLRRVIINRAWDNAAPFSAAEKSRIAVEIEKHTANLWRDGTPGWKKVDLLVSSKLWELSRAAGWNEASRIACTVGRHWVEKHRAAGLVAAKEKDAKRYADYYTPRIIRNREGYQPMDVVIGDVHPLDVVKLHNGREVNARLIAWLDLATNDIHVTIVLLPKGRGIRQEDVARSFVAMVKDWGLPRSLYLDNGSEYKWDEMIQGFSAITSLVDSFHTFINDDASDEIRRVVESNLSGKPLTRAKPYNAPAKQIESVFGILERGFFSMIKGAIGGDRMNKRTHKLGAKPRAFDGSDEEFEASIHEAINFYRNTPQKNGTSPNEKRAAFYAQGWKPYTASSEVFLFAFSEVIKLKVRTCGIEKDGAWYYSDAIIPYIGQTLEIRFAKWDRAQLFIIDVNGKYIAIPKTQTYGQLDQAGAIEQSRRAGVQNAYVRSLKEGRTKLNLIAEVHRHNATLPPPPLLPKGVEVTLGDNQAALTEALKNAPPAIVTPILSGGTSGELLEIPLIKHIDPSKSPRKFNLLDALDSKYQHNEKECNK